MTFSDEEIQVNAFAKGIREIAERSRVEAAEVRMEIRHELGDIQKAQYYNRQNGYVNHTPAERRGITLVFLKHKVTKPWGM